MRDLEPSEIKAVLTRMKRAHGRLASVIRMPEEGIDCESVLTQLAAVNKALSRAGYAIVATGPQQCSVKSDEGLDGVDVQSRWPPALESSRGNVAHSPGGRSMTKRAPG